MNLSEYLTVGIGAIGVFSATLIGLAHAGEQGRRWVKSTASTLFNVTFYAFLVLGSALVIWLFGAQTGVPTRGEILTLLMWIFNGAMGITFAATDLLRWKRQRSQAAES